MEEERLVMVGKRRKKDGKRRMERGDNKIKRE